MLPLPPLLLPLPLRLSFSPIPAGAGRKGGENEARKGAKGAHKGPRKKNSTFTLKHATRVRKGLLNPGFTHAR